ncbi:MAG: aminopeptidase [Candidatus Micrarchaeia archaeon]
MEKIERLSKILVDYSTNIKKGDKVQIVFDLAASPLALEIYKYSLQKGANPWIKVDIPGRRYIFYKYSKKQQLIFFPKHEMFEIKNTDVYIALRAPTNVKELANVEPEKLSLHSRTLKPITDWRVEKTRWCLFYYPTEAQAQEAGMSLKEYEEFVFDSCFMDWAALSKYMQKIKERVEKTKRVEIYGNQTNISFSVEKRKAVVADGKYNMPDGEVFTSVVENSVKGEIYYEIPAIYMGNEAEGIRLEFKNGKVVKAKAEKGERFLKQMLATDKGAKRIGEFGIGLNYKIKKAVKNIIFDEKIGGTIHTALGNGYKETLSKNVSAIHWDLIKDLRKDGEIYFDKELVMKNGKWIIE